MERILKAFGFGLIVASVISIGGMVRADEKSGEALFKQHCSACHPDGGNIINPKKTLHKKDMEANNIKTKEDIVKVMRNPGPGMLKFNDATIPNEKAKEIAEYILKTYNK